MKKIFKINCTHTYAGSIYLLICSCIVLFTSCKKTDYLNVDASNRPPLAAKISFVNARPVNQGLLFWTYTTQVTPTPVPMYGASSYLDAQFGLVQINITAAGSTSYLASRVFGGAATFSASGGPNGPIAGYYHTVFAVKASSQNFTADSLILFYDDLSTPPAGNAKLRFVNLGTKTPAVDVAFNGNTLFTGVKYGAAGGAILSGSNLNAFSIGPFATVTAGSGNLVIKETDTGNPITIKGGGDYLTLQDGKIYTVFINGDYNNISVTILQQNIAP